MINRSTFDVSLELLVHRYSVDGRQHAAVDYFGCFAVYVSAGFQ